MSDHETDSAGDSTRTDGGTGRADGIELLGTEATTAAETGDRAGGLTGFRALLRREVLRFIRRPRNTFLPPMITNVLYFAVFGVILGGRIDQIAGFDYIVFLLPGLIVLGTISNAFENASFSIFHGRWNEYIETVIISPLSNWMFVAAYVIASAIRGVLVGSIIAAIGLVFVTVTDRSIAIAEPLYLVAFMLVISTLFAGLGIIGGLWARDFDYLTVMNQFIVRPLVFFGGVFYSLDVLPTIYRALSLTNPMVYMVNGVRYGFLGYSDVGPTMALAVLSGFTAFVIALDVWLFRRGYGIVD
ncbi:ABC transporter permease [Halovenus sp. WSH3]|uniref:ABC transporter permease n=1 Tax=Halovenus carboxidivorans TaxID=2692199 RepID=A0A6B0T0Q1_9EURY|nr:ABC transporter permease [Halovenus carboxidivorans]MXR51778.1 ABC transporter permease [Halovenus carboxidivorans]